MNKLHENFVHLEELIRTADSLINPITVDKRLEWLMRKDVRGKLFEENPKCFLSMNIGQKTMLFPICSRSGMEDPQIIDFSIKLANRIAGKPDVDVSELQVTLKKLNMLKKKFSQPIPKPAKNAAQKGNSTKNMNQIKSLLSNR